MNKWETNNFTNNIFKMFDLNNDGALSFEEFMFATSAQNFDNVTEKLGWLFDNVYDRVIWFYLISYKYIIIEIFMLRLVVYVMSLFLFNFI